jgi:hypothetical protein
MPYNYHAGYHLRIGIDAYFNNLGNKYLTQALGVHVGLEREQCDMLMSLLQWSYEYVNYDNQLGDVNLDEPLKSTGKFTRKKMTGDPYKTRP